MQVTARLLESVREIKRVMTFMMRRVGKLKTTIEDVLDDDNHMVVGTGAKLERASRNQAPIRYFYCYSPCLILPKSVDGSER